MRWTILVVVLVAILAAVACSGDGAAPVGQQEDNRQLAYDRLLQQARSDVARDPDLNCDPDYQQLVIDQVTSATGAEKVLIQFAMGDACIEAGEWEGGVYSSYHAGAP
jgi:hypothetical protein